jgi:hypothetical protein
MKRLLLITLTLGCCICYAQLIMGKGVTADAKSFSIEQPKADKPNRPIHFLLATSVTVTSESEGMVIRSDRMTGNAKPDPQVPKSYLISDATAVGHVVLVKTVTSKAGKQITQIEGTSADYTSGTTESIVKMAGPMSIKSVDESGQPTMVATGNSGIAYMEPLKQTKMDNALRKATMDGNVHLTLTQIDPKTKGKTTVYTTSDHMVLENLAAGKKVTLTGHVRISAEGVQLSGHDHVVAVIDKDGAMHLNTDVK